MKVIIVMVMSLDGKTTKWHDPKISMWTSREDKEYFMLLRDKAKCIVMGRKTYETAKEVMKHLPSKLRVIVTSQPAKYKTFEIQGQLEFSSKKPKSILSDLSKRGYNTVFLLGGETINGKFLKDDLVSEMWVTVEPVVFGAGNGLAGSNQLDIKLKLISSKKLNKHGTLLLKYAVVTN